MGLANTRARFCILWRQRNLSLRARIEWPRGSPSPCASPADVIRALVVRRAAARDLLKSSLSACPTSPSSAKQPMAEEPHAIGPFGPIWYSWTFKCPSSTALGVIARSDRDRMPAVVFVHRYDRYALRAFEVHALDFLLKP